MEYFFNQNKNYGYYDQPTHSTGQAMATAAMIAGILCIVTMWTLYLPIIIGGLGIIFAYLSKGFESKLSSNAKTGMVFSAGGVGICVIILLGGTIYLLNNPERFLEIARQIDLQMGALVELGFSYEDAVRQILNSAK